MVYDTIRYDILAERYHRNDYCETFPVGGLSSIVITTCNTEITHTVRRYGLRGVNKYTHQYISRELSRLQYIVENRAPYTHVPFF